MVTSQTQRMPLQIRMNAPTDRPKHLRIIVPARIAPRAVMRNRVRRHVRAAFHRIAPHANEQYTILVQGTTLPRGEQLDRLVMEIVKKFGKVSS